jgi:NDP-sugar pyrophosphorylase family protein
MATRLRPVTETIPKALVKVAGEPFVFHQLRLLKKHGVRRVTFCTGYRAEMIEACLGDGSALGMDISYSEDGPVLLGTGGAIRKAAPLLGENFFILYGDSYLPCDYMAVQQAFVDSGKPGLMTVYRNDGMWDSSNVEFQDGRLIAYDKSARTSRMKHIDYGLGVFSASAFTPIPENAPCDLVEVYQRLLKDGDLAALEMRGRFYEAGSFNGIAELERFLEAASDIR